MTRLEGALAIATKWVVVTAAASLALFAIPRSLVADQRLAVFTVQLGVIVGLTTALAFRLRPMIDPPFFSSTKRPWLASAVAVTALATGFAALVTLASSAVLRYDPSLQFLQLLSALDVAWSAAALGLGVGALTRSRRAGLAAAVVLDVICVFSIWNYLRVVGFATDGGWVVSARDLLTLVIPFDVAAAMMAIAALLLASRRLD